LNVSSTEKGQIASLAAVNTTLAACAGALSALFTSTIWDYRFLGYHTYDLTMTMNGCLTGLVAITSGCASVDTWAAVVIGVVAGWVYMFSSKLIIKLRIDDAVDAIPVHMFGGMWGVAATGLFSERALLMRAYGVDQHIGWFFDFGDFTLMGTQLVGILFIFGWTSVVTGIFFYTLNMLGMLRISPLEEEAGMDISRHKGACYDIQPVDDSTIKELHASRHGGVKKIIPMEEADELRTSRHGGVTYDFPMEETTKPKTDGVEEDA
jgi:ammonium transporter, Amt family